MAVDHEAILRIDAASDIPCCRLMALMLYFAIIRETIVYFYRFV